MGYSLSPEQVTHNEYLLEKILLKISIGQEAEIASSKEDLSRDHFTLNSILKSAQAFPEVCDGRYQHLRERVLIRPDYERAVLRVVPKTSRTHLVAKEDTELDVLSRLSSYGGRMTVITFEPTPAFTEEALAAALDAGGWKLLRHTRMEPHEGMLSYAVERAGEPPDAFEAVRDDFSHLT